MRSLLASLAAGAVVLAGAGCKSDCDHYGELEAKCSRIPARERAMTRPIAVGFCIADDSKTTRAEAACARRSRGSCVAYLECKKRIRP